MEDTQIQSSHSSVNPCLPANQNPQQSSTSSSPIKLLFAQSDSFKGRESLLEFDQYQGYLSQTSGNNSNSYSGSGSGNSSSNSSSRQANKTPKNSDSFRSSSNSNHISSSIASSDSQKTNSINLNNQNNNGCSINNNSIKKQSIYKVSESPISYPHQIPQQQLQQRTPSQNQQSQILSKSILSESKSIPLSNQLSQLRRSHSQRRNNKAASIIPSTQGYDTSQTQKNSKISPPASQQVDGTISKNSSNSSGRSRFNDNSAVGNYKNNIPTLKLLSNTANSLNKYQIFDTSRLNCFVNEPSNRKLNNATIPPQFTAMNSSSISSKNTSNISSNDSKDDQACSSNPSSRLIIIDRKQKRTADNETYGICRRVASPPSKIEPIGHHRRTISSNLPLNCGANLNQISGNNPVDKDQRQIMDKIPYSHFDSLVCPRKLIAPVSLTSQDSYDQPSNVIETNSPLRITPQKRLLQDSKQTVPVSTATPFKPEVRTIDLQQYLEPLMNQSSVSSLLGQEDHNSSGLLCEQEFNCFSAEKDQLQSNYPFIQPQTFFNTPQQLVSSLSYQQVNSNGQNHSNIQYFSTPININPVWTFADEQQKQYTGELTPREIQHTLSTNPSSKKSVSIRSPKEDVFLTNSQAISQKSINPIVLSTLYTEESLPENLVPQQQHKVPHVNPFINNESQIFQLPHQQINVFPQQQGINQQQQQIRIMNYPTQNDSRFLIQPQIEKLNFSPNNLVREEIGENWVRKSECYPRNENIITSDFHLRSSLKNEFQIQSGYIQQNFSYPSNFHLPPNQTLKNENGTSQFLASMKTSSSQIELDLVNRQNTMNIGLGEQELQTVQQKVMSLKQYQPNHRRGNSGQTNSTIISAFVPTPIIKPASNRSSFVQAPVKIQKEELRNSEFKANIPIPSSLPQVSNQTLQNQKQQNSFNCESQQQQQTGRHRLIVSDSNKEFRIDLRRIVEDGRTTLMIKNIPNKYEQDLLLQTINRKHKDTYDFFYLPIDFTNNCNVGYAFINFKEAKFIESFYREFNEQKWKKFNSDKICQLYYARIQGSEGLNAHFKSSSVMNQKDNRFKPLFIDTRNKSAIQQIVNLQVIKQSN